MLLLTYAAGESSAACGFPYAGMLLTILVLSGAGLVFFKDNAGTALTHASLVAGLMQLCFGTVDSAIGLFSGRLFRLVSNSAAASFMIMTCSIACSFLLFCVCCRFLCRFLPSCREAPASYTLLLIVPLFMVLSVSGFILYSVYGNTVIVDGAGVMAGPHFHLLCLQALCIPGLFCIVFTYRKLSGSVALQMKLSLPEQEARYQQQYVEETKARYDLTKAARHDIKRDINPDIKI